MESRDGVFVFEFKKEIGKLSIELSPTFAIAQGKVIDTAHVQDIGWGLDSIVRPFPIGEVSDGPNLSTSLHKDFQCGFMLEYRFNEDHLLNWNTHGRANWYKNEDSLGSAINSANVAGYPGELYSLVSGLTLESEFFSERLVNLVGAKAYHYRSNVTEASTGLAARLVNTRNRQTSFGFDEGLRFTIVKEFFLKAGYQHNLRIPAAAEIFGDGVFIIPSSRLKAEKGNNFHAGLLFDMWDIPFLVRVQYELNGYYSMIEDMIRLKAGNGMGAAYYNLESATIKGFDTELKIDFTNWLYCWGNLTLQDLRCTDSKDDKSLIGKELPNTPWFYCNFGVELFKDNLFVKHGSGKIYGAGNFTEKYYFNWKTTTQDKSRMIPRNLTFDAGVEYSLFGSKLSFSADVSNITDKETFDDYHLPLPGRTFAVKVRGSFIK
jgi:outer membrane receptor protein involved in Fe transport